MHLRTILPAALALALAVPFSSLTVAAPTEIELSHQLGEERAERLETGNLILKLSEDDSNFIIIEIKNEKNKTVAKKYLSPLQKQIGIDGLAAGNYTIIGTFDVNKNGYWDSGNFEQKIQPEKKIVLKSTVGIKSGWDIEAEINPKNKTEKLSPAKEKKETTNRR